MNKERTKIDSKVISAILDDLMEGPKSPEELGVSRHNMDKIAERGYVRLITEPKPPGTGRGAPKKKFEITPKGRGYKNLFSIGMMFIEQLDDIGDLLDSKFGESQNAPVVEKPPKTEEVKSSKSQQKVVKEPEPPEKNGESAKSRLRVVRKKE